MTRYPDWRVRLHHYLEAETARAPVEEINCASFAAGAVEAMTGENPLGELAGMSAEDLFEWVSSQGYGSAEEALDARLVARENRNLAQIGDVAVLKGNNFALGVVIGADVRVLTIDGTYGNVPLRMAKTVYGV